MNGPRLLLIEDSDDDAMLVLDVLRRDGIEVEVARAANRMEFERALEAGPWDIVVSDYSLPQFTALDVIREVRSRSLDIPVIIVSGAIGEEAAVETMRLGADDYVMKGCLQRLPAAVRREIREAQFRDESRIVEQRLDDNAHLMEQAQALARMGYFAWDLGSDVAVWSDELYRIHGVRRGAFEPSLQSWLALVTPDQRERVREEIESSLEAGTLHTTVRIGEGEEVRELELVGDVDRDATGRAIRMLGVIKDVTEQRLRERERERMSRELELLLESTVQAIVTVDLEGRCTMVNAAAERLTGVAAAELEGQKWVDALPQRRADGSLAADFENPVAQVLGTGSAVQISDALFWRRDGSSTWVDISVSPLLEDGRLKGAVALMTDTTERRLLKNELERADRLSSLGRMAATIAHEFNNVLMGIQPFAELIARKTAEDSIRNATDHILRSVKRGRRVTQDILRFTRPAEPTLQRVDARSLLEDLRQELRGLLAPSIDLEVAADEEIEIEADAQQIMQVLLNLSLNARDAMPAGGTLSIRARRCLSGETYPFGVVPTADRFAQIAVRDTGTGIPEEMLTQLFDPFFTTKKLGTGLGLPIAHKVVEIHGGHIFVESRVGEGTTFHLFLPLARERSHGGGTAGRRAGEEARR
jgi:PAS domain S-box-containing protein